MDEANREIEVITKALPNTANGARQWRSEVKRESAAVRKEAVHSDLVTSNVVLRMMQEQAKKSGKKNRDKPDHSNQKDKHPGKRGACLFEDIRL